ncbi:ABC transporter permease [Ruicaihuangia caeni]|uniref:ABC transporter permease n=1 Tax=Ruicaihuangia caeni TaxID=3042517 RepID=UPI0033904D76
MRDLKPVLQAAGFVVLAFLLAAVIFQAAGYDIGAIGVGLVDGAIAGPGAFINTVRWALPLAVIGLGVAVCFRAGFFNVGAQGQLYMGAIASTAIALHLPGPAWLVTVVAVVAAVVAGALWSLIAAVLKVYTGADEVLTTLMLNFIGVLVLDYVASGPLKDVKGSGQVASSERVAEDLRLSDAFGASPTLIAITLLLAAAVWIWMARTKGGLTSKLAGRNPVMVRWQGGNPNRMVLSSFAFAGATAGLAGAMHVLGPAGRLVSNFSPDLGFTAVLVALVGLLSVPGVLIAAVFFGGLQAALQYLPVVSDLPRAGLDLIQGVIAVMITLQLRWQFKRRRERAQQAERQPTPAATTTASSEGSSSV